MLLKLKNADGWPSPFEEGASIWDDEYISRNMLQAHLDESHDKASYKRALREKVVSAVVKKCELKIGDHVLDLGCGPGLYAKEFAKLGIKYTGVDISTQSIGYAMAHRGEYADMISYMRGDYTDCGLGGGYDCAVMIWCDFGALSPEKRDKMLSNVSDALKPDGMFCFDVYAISSPFEKDFISWRVEEGGFWRQDLYAVLEKSKRYESVGAGLYCATVIWEDGVKEYRVWDKRYSKAELKQVLQNAGFDVLSVKKGGLSRAQKNMYGVYLKAKRD